jgi:hypothetical protein
MQGRRIPDGKWWDEEAHPALRQPGDYGRGALGGESGLWVILPNGVGPACLRNKWTITDEPDGTITVSPSILDSGGWHGYLERGQWREC